MDRRTLLAFFLCLIIFLGWQKLYVERLFPQQGQTQSITTVPPSNGEASPPASPERKPTPHQARPAETLALHTGTGNVILNDSGAFVKSWDLKEFTQGISKSSPHVDLSSVTHQDAQIRLAFDDTQFEYLNDVQGDLSKTDRGASWSYGDSKVKITRELFTSGSQPYIDMRINAEFKGTAPRYAFLSINSQGVEKDPEAQDRQLVYWSNQSIERVPLHDQVTQKQILTPVKYIAATNRYFVFSLVAQSPLEANALVQPVGPNSGRISLVYPVTGNSISIPVRVYFGPKELDLLRKVEPTLDHTVDFGWFTFFAYPLLKLLKWLFQFVQNYGVAIIILTLLLKVLTYPLTYKSMKSMKKMAKLQPQLQRIREKFKDDKEAINREMLTMMRSHGYNPMAGCLPMVIQMPIFFALYRVLYSSIELYHAPFVLWIKDLSAQDPYYVTPVLLSLTMFIQQKLTPNTATDPAQAKMMQLMPLIFGAFMIGLPAGLTIYMLANALAGIVQQVILNKKLETI